MTKTLHKSKEFPFLVLLWVFLFTLIPAQLLAHDFEVNGIYYKILSDTEVEVTYQGDSYNSSNDEYQGNVTIPSTVIYSSKEYSVTSIGTDAFNYCSSLTSVTIPSSVSSIQYDAFYNCDALKSVIIPNSVTSIGRNAFSNCKNLTNVTLPGNLSIIPDRCFYECESMREITIPSSVSKINEEAFSGCNSLQKVTMLSEYAPEVVKPNFSIIQNYTTYPSEASLVVPCGSSVFYKIAYFETIFKNIEELPGEKFTTSWTSFPAMENLWDVLDKYGFQIPTQWYIDEGKSKYFDIACEWSKPNPSFVFTISGGSLTFGSGIVTAKRIELSTEDFDNVINDVCIYGLQCDMSGATVSVSVGGNEYSAQSHDIANHKQTVIFRGSSKGKISILIENIPDGAVVSFVGLGVSYTEKPTFDYGDYYNDAVYRIVDSNLHTAELAKWNGSSSSVNVSIPEKVKFEDTEYAVVGIADGAFQDNKDVITISMPASIRYIGKDAFNRCEKLFKCNIGEGVTSIKEEAFADCSSLTSITIPASVVQIKDDCFNGCSSLSEVIFIDSKASISIGDSHTNKGIFDRLPIGTVYIGRKLSYTTSPFENNVSVRECNFAEDKLEAIPSEFFYGCKSLKSITIPASVTFIGGNAFRGCFALEEVTINDSDRPLDIEHSYDIYDDGRWYYAQFVNSPIKKLYIGRDLTYETRQGHLTYGGTSPFSFKNTLNEVTFGPKVTKIDYMLLKGCKAISEITIPESITNIEREAFKDCSGLMNVISKASTPATLGTNAFDKFKAALSILNDLSEVYQNSDWKNYFSGFEEHYGELTIEVEGNGNVYGSNFESIVNGTQLQGNEFRLIILPEANSVISDIVLNGESIKEQLTSHSLTISKMGVLKIIFSPINEATLTIKNHESHSITHYYSEGTEAKIDIVPETGWILYSLTYNGEDMTEKVENNTFTTPALNGYNILELVVKRNTESSVNETQAPARKISFRKDGEILEVLNLDDNEEISIYNVDGILQYQGTNHTVSLNTNEIYILRTKHETLKFSF